MGKEYDTAYKVEVCKRIVENGETAASISRELGISENTVYGWVNRYRQNRETPFVGSGHVKAEDAETKRACSERTGNCGKR